LEPQRPAQPAAEDRSALRAGAWMFALSLPLGMFAPAVGHFIAGMIGGRIAKTLRAALPGALLTAAFWAITVYMVAPKPIRSICHPSWLSLHPSRC
jgi:hypothetical protein